MILINLLPHREAARKRRKDVFNLLLVLSAVVGAALGGLIYGYYEFLKSQQQRVNNHIAEENAKLDEQIKDILTLEDEIAALRERQKAVEDLQQRRNDPVRLFNEMTAKMPDGLYLTNIKQTAQVVELLGTAQSNERVSEYLRNLKDSDLLEGSPRLDETASAEIVLPGKTAKSKVYRFKIVLTLKVSEQAKDAGGVPASAEGG